MKVKTFDLFNEVTLPTPYQTNQQSDDIDINKSDLSIIPFHNLPTSIQSSIKQELESKLVSNVYFKHKRGGNRGITVPPKRDIIDKDINDELKKIIIFKSSNNEYYYTDEVIKI